VRSNGVIVQSAWEPTERRSHESDEEGHARKSGSSSKLRSQEVIDVDADEEESRYAIPRRRKINEDIDAKTVFTADDGSEEDEVIAIETSEGEGSLAEEEAEYPVGEEEDQRAGPQVKIDRKRAFWAAKAGTGTSSAGLGTGVA
jgi:hypothetical protein